MFRTTPAVYDGIWSSFTAAYFVDFANIFAGWSSLLKRKAWVCIIDIDDLLGHKPLSEDTERKIAAFYEQAANTGRYDFRIGKKIESVLRGQGFKVTSVTLDDQELSFDGAASEDVEKLSWLSPSPCTTNFRLVRDLLKNRKQAANSRNGLHSYVLWSVSVRFNRHAVK